ncbi:hypothetical protein [Sediminibacter sp. Hel_I_10]|uniref:hypothetical protein n=1 Tax=Sediminibacter sp. Hel_I_10 TaxID=1392490 RepID=UPI00047C84E9|nr:hypothetical protein [Sediminibacter sp. Hel_I_10]
MPNSIYMFNSNGYLQGAPISLSKAQIEDHLIVVTWISDVAKGIMKQNSTTKSNDALLSAISDYSKFITIENNNEATSSVNSHKGKINISDYLKDEMFANIDNNFKLIFQSLFDVLKEGANNNSSFILDWWNSLERQNNALIINLGIANLTSDGGIKFSILTAKINQHISSGFDFFNPLDFKKSIEISTLFLTCNYLISEFETNKSDIVSQLMKSKINLPKVITT